jgi:hypothetical protein
MQTTAHRESGDGQAEEKRSAPKVHSNSTTQWRRPFGLAQWNTETWQLPAGIKSGALGGVRNALSHDGRGRQCVGTTHGDVGGGVGALRALGFGPLRCIHTRVSVATDGLTIHGWSEDLVRQ